MLARACDRRKSARRRTGHDGDRVDARYRIADDRGAQGRWTDVKESRTRFAPQLRVDTTPQRVRFARPDILFYDADRVDMYQLICALYLMVRRQTRKAK
jgi:hypothetical protein